MRSPWRWLASHFVSYIEERGHSSVSPVLEVVYTSGRYVLHSDRANYSFGELHRAFADVLAEVDIAARKPQNVLILGLGAGSIVHILQQHGLQPQIDGVELDPEVIRLGSKYFGLDKQPNLKVIMADAADHIQQQTTQYDLVCVDVFVDDEVPATLDTLPVLQALQRALAPGGLLIWNRVVTTEQNRDRTQHFLQMAELVFPGHRLHRVLTNYMLLYEQPGA